MKNIKKQWFTLVELIVVITILAILWSIAFISLQGYSADARNSKRTSDLGSLQSSLTVKQTSGTNITAFVTANAWANTVTNVSIAWQTNPTGYSAGTVNYNALGVKQIDFQDPQSNSPYVIWVTTLVGWVYQLASNIEQAGWSKVARVVWNWNPRGITTGIAVSTWATDIILSANTNVNFFKLQDIIDLDGTWGGTATWIINRVSADGMTLTLSTWATIATNITIASAESTSLIDGNNGTAPSATTWPVTDNWLILPY